MLVFEERGKQEYPEKNLLVQSREQTQPTYDAESGNRTQATLVGGECTVPSLLNISVKYFYPVYQSWSKTKVLKIKVSKAFSKSGKRTSPGISLAAVYLMILSIVQIFSPINLSFK